MKKEAKKSSFLNLDFYKNKFRIMFECPKD